MRCRAAPMIRATTRYKWSVPNLPGVQSVNFVLLGEESIAKGLGKKGTSTDLTLYDKKESGMIRTWVAPSGFPEKIQPLFQAIGICEYAVLHVSSLDKFAGEQIIALDTLGMDRGILSHAYEVDKEKLESTIRGTVLEEYERVEPARIGESCGRFEPLRVPGETRIVIDHAFEVRGVGTVALGKVISGTVAKYQNLKILPSGMEVMIKSIQMHDEPVSEAESPARVGVALKGATVNEINRGDILCEDDAASVSTKIEIDFEKNPYHTGGYAVNQTCLVNTGLQMRAARFLSIEPVILELEKPAVFHASDTAVLLRPESETVRILGSGAIR